MILPEVSSAEPTRKGGRPGLLYACSLPISVHCQTDWYQLRVVGGRAVHGPSSRPAFNIQNTTHTFEGGLDEIVLIFHRQLTSYTESSRVRHRAKMISKRMEIADLLR